MRRRNCVVQILCRTLTALQRAPRSTAYPGQRISLRQGAIMSVELDPNPAFAAFAHPERLVSSRMAGRPPGHPRPRRRRIRRRRAALRDRPHPRRRQDRLAHRPQRPRPPRLRRRCGLRQAARLQGHLPRHDRRHLRRQEQLVGRLRPLGVHALRPRGRAPARRRPRQVGGRGPRVHDRRRPPPPPSTTRSSSATTPRSAPSRKTCSRTSATR